MTLVGNRLQWVLSGGAGGVCAQCRMLNAECTMGEEGMGKVFLARGRKPERWGGMNRPVAYLETSFVGSSNEILEEVYRAREKLWQLGGGTLRGMGEYLRECGRRAKERRVLWIESEEEREAIGAEVRARLAREAAEGEWKDATAVGEERARYGAARSEKGKEKSEQRAGERSNDTTIQRSNDATIQRSNDPAIPRTR